LCRQVTPGGKWRIGDSVSSPTFEGSIVSPDELYLAWGEAWTTRDQEHRVELLKNCTTEDVQFVPPDERPVVKGRDALLAHMNEFTADWPMGVKVQLVRPAQAHHDWSRATILWEFPGMTAQATDVMHVRGGQIAAMIDFAD
jgi:hypothetical protein